MPSYRRFYKPGGTFFFTLVTDNRVPFFAEPEARKMLREAIKEAGEARPFTIDALVLLPEHLDLILTLPPDDADYSTRIAHFKARFTHYWLEHHEEQARSDYRIRTRRRGVWQPRFWEHWIQDREDFNLHHEYICFNPVKHGHSLCPHAWQHSTFHRAVEKRLYEPDWLCRCGGREIVVPTFDGLPVGEIECE